MDIQEMASTCMLLSSPDLYAHRQPSKKFKGRGGKELQKTDLSSEPIVPSAPPNSDASDTQFYDYAVPNEFFLTSSEGYFTNTPYLVYPDDGIAADSTNAYYGTYENSQQHPHYEISEQYLASNSADAYDGTHENSEQHPHVSRPYYQN